MRQIQQCKIRQKIKNKICRINKVLFIKAKNKVRYFIIKHSNNITEKLQE